MGQALFSTVNLTIGSSDCCPPAYQTFDQDATHENTILTPSPKLNFRVRESWYSEAAARAIEARTQEAPTLAEEEESSAGSLLNLERRLRTPAIQFGGEGRRGVFNKASV